MIGQTISHYKILEKLGEGGMGVVYKAEDTKLKRTVALKFLPSSVSTDDEVKQRFIHEAQAASALNHTNICSIHAIEEFEKQQFIDMEFVEGKTIGALLKEKELSLKEVVDIALQIAEGLNAAHKKGIVHRDIKPDNIMITDENLVKIMDFGLAKLKGSSKLTKTHSTLGTLSYMSPEQARGEEVDHRSDIFSFGAVLYEMITGRRPFKGEHEAAIMYSLMNETPEPLARYKTKVPGELQRVVDKALAKNKGERYQNVEDLLVDLRAIRSAAQSHTVSQKKNIKGRKSKLVISGAAAVVLIALAIVFLPRLFKSVLLQDERGTMDHRKKIVVLPFENLGPPEDEYFANGTTDAITARLASVSGLGVISRQSAMQYKKTTKSIRQIGNELGVDYVLEGTVQRERPGDPKSKVRVIPQLIRVSDDTHVWADKYDEIMTEVFRIQSDIAEKVANQLDVALLEPERRAIEKRPTENLAAYESYLRGMEHRFGMKSVYESELAVQEYRKAVSLDPRFAEAWAGLTIAYHELYWVWELPIGLTQQAEAAKQAEELAPDNPMTQCALGYMAYANREFKKALTYFETAAHLQPSGDATIAIGFTLRRLGEWQKALDHFEKARWLIPHSYNLYLDCLGFTNTVMRRFDEAEQNLNVAISLDPRVGSAYLYKTRVLLGRDGNVEAAKQVMREMSNSVGIAEALESWAPGDWNPTELRLMPEQWAEHYNTFERQHIDRYRLTQPAKVAVAHLSRAIIIEAQKGRPSAVVRYDSARIHYERMIRSNPHHAYVSVRRVNLGLAYAGLGRCKEAIREGKEAVRMVPLSRDAFTGEQLLRGLLEIYMMCGEYDAAIDEIETLLAVPGYLTVALLRIDPLWDPIRNNPRFRRLLEGK